VALSPRQRRAIKRAREVGARLLGAYGSVQLPLALYGQALDGCDVTYPYNANARRYLACLIAARRGETRGLPEAVARVSRDALSYRRCGMGETRAVDGHVHSVLGLERELEIGVARTHDFFAYTRARGQDIENSIHALVDPPGIPKAITASIDQVAICVVKEAQPGATDGRVEAELAD
jgi:hypothetical protein